MNEPEPPTFDKIDAQKVKETIAKIEGVIKDKQQHLEQYEQYPESITADAGYGSEQKLQYLSDKSSLQTKEWLKGKSDLGM